MTYTVIQISLLLKKNIWISKLVNLVVKKKKKEKKNGNKELI